MNGDQAKVVLDHLRDIARHVAFLAFLHLVVAAASVALIVRFAIR